MLRSTSRARRAGGAPRRALASTPPQAPYRARIRRWVPRAASAAEAVSCVESGDRVFIHSATASPRALVQALCKRHEELEDVEVCHIHVEGPAPYAHEPVSRSIRANNFFIGSNVREAVNTGHADFVPIFLSEVPALFRRNVLPLDVALLSVSPPDQHGYCSLGPSVDVSLQAMLSAKKTVAQVNSRIPRTHGEGVVHVSNLDVLLEEDEELPEATFREPSDVERRIGHHIAQLVEDGATLQMGIGAIPDAVLAELGDHRHLGVHTEMFSEGVIDLVESGVIDCSQKTVMPNVITASFLMGTRRLYDWVDDNPMVHMYPSEFVNDPHVIRQNPRVTAINSCIEIDLTGQVCADSIGTRFFSGVGGQLDFERGAALSEGGVPIIAMPSTTSRGESRIVSMLKPGAGVATTRAHVHWVVTEYGAVNLFGRNIRQRAELLISIAHPKHRAELDKLAEERCHTVTK